MNIRVEKKHILHNIFAKIMIYGTNIAILPFLLRNINSTELGIWYTFIAVSSFIALLDLGFQPTISRNISYLLAGASSLQREGVASSCKVNYSLLAELFFLSKHFYNILFYIVLVIFLSIGSIFILKISTNKDILFTWLIFIFANSILVKYNFVSSILISLGKLTTINNINIIAKLVYLFLIILTLYFKIGILGLAIASLLSNIWICFLQHRRLNKIKLIQEIEKINVKKKSFWPNFKILSSNSYKYAITSFGVFLLFKSMVILSTLFFGTAVTARYALTVQAFDLLISLTRTAFETYIPKLAQLMVNRKNYSYQIRQIFLKCSILSIFIYILFSITLIIFGNHLLILLKSKTYFLNQYQIGLISFLYLMELIHGNCAIFISIKNHIPFVIPTIITGIMTVISAIILIKWFNLGVTSFILSQIICQLAYNAWKWPLEVFRDFKKT